MVWNPANEDGDNEVDYTRGFNYAPIKTTLGLFQWNQRQRCNSYINATLGQRFDNEYQLPRGVGRGQALDEVWGGPRAYLVHGSSCQDTYGSVWSLIADRV